MIKSKKLSFRAVWAREEVTGTSSKGSLLQEPNNGAWRIVIGSPLHNRERISCNIVAILPPIVHVSYIRAQTGFFRRSFFYSFEQLFLTIPVQTVLEHRSYLPLLPGCRLFQRMYIFCPYNKNPPSGTARCFVIPGMSTWRLPGGNAARLGGDLIAGRVPFFLFTGQLLNRAFIWIALIWMGLFWPNHTV